MVFSRRLACSFCGKEEVVGRFIARPQLHICDECAAIAARLLQDEPVTDASVPQTQRSVIEQAKDLWHGLLTRIRSRRMEQASFLSE